MISSNFAYSNAVWISVQGVPVLNQWMPDLRRRAEFTDHVMCQNLGHWGLVMSLKHTLWLCQNSY